MLYNRYSVEKQFGWKFQAVSCAFMQPQSEAEAQSLTLSTAASAAIHQSLLKASKKDHEKCLGCDQAISLLIIKMNTLHKLYWLHQNQVIINLLK